MNPSESSAATSLTREVAIAQLALYKITIDTQNALLAGLTEARDDDGVIDFDTCIDSSDKGRIDALIVLQQLFQRRLAEEMERKKNTPAKEEQAKTQPSSSLPPITQSTSNTATQPAPVPQPQQTPPPTPKVKKSRGFNVFRHRESSKNSQELTQPETLSMATKPGSSPRAPRRDISPLGTRRNTTASTSSTSTWSSAGSQNSAIAPDSISPGSISRSGTSTSTINAVSRQNTNMSAFSGISSMTGMTVMSAVSQMSNLSTASTLAPITKYGGCCKKAFELREGLVKKALILTPVGFYGRNMNYKCASVKCQFSGQAGQDRKGFRMDDRVFTAAGLQYRWLFLAKSHMQQQDDKVPSFRCLVCMMLGDESGIYHGARVLLSHLASHQGALLGDTRLEGPLIFTNRGATPDQDDEFDVKFPEVEQSTPAPPVPEKGAVVVVASGVPAESHRTENMVPSRAPTAPTAFAYDDNPWAT